LWKIVTINSENVIKLRKKKISKINIMKKLETYYEEIA